MTAKEAYLKAGALCSRGEQCSHDIAEKMRHWDVNTEDIPTIIENLISEKFIDDARFCAAFCRDKSRFQGWGKMKIRFALKQKRIPADIIDGCLCEINDDEYAEQAITIMRIKARTLKGKEPAKARASLYRFGISRGFESSLVLKNINKILEFSDDDEY
ncbi:MAG: regulatory protein RecX [Muribaculaceae bacterium]|nr:regulatory protein RecX [Muribaculaceae bacterium]